VKISYLDIENFRGIKEAKIHFPDNVVLVGDNNIGKSTILEALDLVLGPERLHRQAPINEHDFYAGDYIGEDGLPISIKIEAIVTQLNDDQIRHFNANIEWWLPDQNRLINSPPIEQIESTNAIPALRVRFEGEYDVDEDNFVVKTYYASPQLDDGEYELFKTKDKRVCGFLLLRTLRTGSRALSLERGSLLDIILRLQEKRFTMWEDILSDLRGINVAESEEFEISQLLGDIQSSLQKFVPIEWASSPHFKVSEMTRESLRKTLTVFMGTGSESIDGDEYSVPFKNQGTGTINTLVLAMLTIIAELKQNVIFAMEEPEIAIPPHAQRRVTDSVRSLSSQAIFTTHSPYVLDEFPPENLLVLSSNRGVVTAHSAALPPAVKLKTYRTEIRTRFCECLLARKILITEGRTEYDSISVAARRLNECDSTRFKSLESLGIAVIDAQTETQIAPLAAYFRGFGKTVYALSDSQSESASATISSVVDGYYESPETGFEKLVVAHTSETALRRFVATTISDGDWPQNLGIDQPRDDTPIEDLKLALLKLLKKTKGSGNAARLLEMCETREMPEFLVSMIEDISSRETMQRVEDPSL